MTALQVPNQPLKDSKNYKNVNLVLLSHAGALQQASGGQERRVHGLGIPKKDLIAVQRYIQSLSSDKTNLET